MVLPAFGMICEMILPVFARKPIFGYKAIAASTAAIAFLGLLVWAHHMFATPTPTVRARPSSCCRRSRSRCRPGSRSSTGSRRCGAGTIVFTTPLLFAVGLARAVRDRRHHGRDAGGLPGRLAADRHLLRRRAHALRAVRRRRCSGSSAGLYYWFPKMTGRMMSESAREAVVLADVHRLQRDLPGPALGRACRGCRAGSTSTRRATSDGTYNLISTIGSFILGVGVLVTVVNVVCEHQAAASAPGNDPWQGEHARVVHDLAAAAEQLRRRSRACAASSR